MKMAGESHSDLFVASHMGVLPPLARMSPYPSRQWPEYGEQEDCSLPRQTPL